jgi:RND family efflux transporter MFP subunit
MNDTPSPENPALKPEPKRLSGRTLALVAALLAGGAASAWFFITKPVANDTKQVAAVAVDRPVLVQTVRFSESRQPRLLVGTVRARVEGDVAFRVAGKIENRVVQVGDRVKAGALIAALDATDLALQRESAVAELTAATSSERQAQAEYARITDLRARGWSTEQSLDRQKAAIDEARSRRERAERNLGIATNAQSYAELRAQHDGVVTALFVEAGQVVAAGQAIVRIARDGDREAQIAIPEHELELARTARAEVSLWSAPDRAMPARLREISPTADAATRTFQARYVLPDMPADAPLGQTASLLLSPGGSGRVARLPLAAVLNEGGGTEVFVVNNRGELARRSVKVSAFDAREATIASGLDEGEQVVTMGVHKLRVGQTVRVISTDRQG